jgi:hypothetical protein
MIMAMLASCTQDPIPHCSRCFRKFPKAEVQRDTNYILCDKTDAEFSAWEARENAKYPNSSTDCVERDTTKYK